jgi:hypothetical protein
MTTPREELVTRAQGAELFECGHVCWDTEAKRALPEVERGRRSVQLSLPHSLSIDSPSYWLSMRTAP